MTMIDVVMVTKTCVVCDQDSGILVPREGYEKWQAGAFVQDAFPDMSAADREVLVSGTHDKCWNEMYDEEGWE